MVRTGIANSVSLPSTYANNNGNPPYNTNPTSNTTATSAKMYKLNGANGDKTGLGITLRVMAGDNVNIFGRSYWSGGSPDNSNSTVVNDLLTALASTSAVVNAGKGATASALTGSSVTPGELASFLSTAPLVSGRPKAYINWILFDEQFRPVSNSSGFSAVDNSSGILKTHTQGVSITKNGYLYVYCSNESNIDVFFDNLQLIQNRGPLLEETHYYPFGLTMAGISSKGAGKLENRYKYNGIEFDEDLGLNAYEAFYRTLDPSIGRWWQIDPKLEANMENWSPYASNFDNPIRYSDPKGDCPTCKEVWKDIKDAGKQTWSSIKSAANTVYNGAVNSARVGNAYNPLANAVELATGKSAQSDFTDAKPRLQAASDLVVNTIGLFGGELAALGSKVNVGPAVIRSAGVSEEVLSAGANEFSRLELISGNQSSRTVGTNIKLINSGQELSPIKVAVIDGKKYVLDGHHRLEAATRTGSAIKFAVVPESGWKGMNYSSKSEILNAAANASGQPNKLSGKIVNQYAQ